MTLLPNVECSVSKATGRDRYGQPVLGPAVPAWCAVVKLDLGANKTSVRADSSATRGQADEIEAVARLLFPAFTVTPEVSDVVELRDAKLRVRHVHPRFSVLGRIDHYQVECDIWEG